MQGFLLLLLLLLEGSVAIALQNQSVSQGWYSSCLMFSSQLVSGWTQFLVSLETLVGNCVSLSPLLSINILQQFVIPEIQAKMSEEGLNY